jgi:ribosomal protein S18 acetylase RimI-like enzyme
VFIRYLNIVIKASIPNSIDSFKMKWKRDDVCGLRLGVDHNNYLAQKTYQKLGMHESNYFMYEQTKKNVFENSNTHLPHNNE